MHCPHCSAPVAQGQRVCTYCGQELPQPQADTTTRVMGNYGPANAPQPFGQPQPPGYNSQPTYYSPPPTPTPGMGYYQGYPAPAQNTGNPVVMWLGVAFMILAVLGPACLLGLLAVAASDPETADNSGDALLGGIICGLGLLALFGIPGAVMFFVGRRRNA